MPERTQRLIVVPELVDQLLYHDLSRTELEIGPLNRYMDRSLVQEADTTMLVREVKGVFPEYKPHVEPHIHDVSEIYGIIGDLTVEVILEGERHRVRGPVCIFVPAGMMHAIHYVEGSGYLVAVLRKGMYE